VVFVGCSAVSIRDFPNEVDLWGGYMTTEAPVIYQPKGSMCIACVKAGADCSGFPFHTMPKVARVPGAFVVLCTYFEKREGAK
jgi:hypothetical protein